MNDYVVGEREHTNEYKDLWNKAFEKERKMKCKHTIKHLRANRYTCAKCGNVFIELSVERLEKLFKLISKFERPGYAEETE